MSGFSSSSCLGCVCKQVRLIHRLQEAASDNSSCLTCDKRTLGTTHGGHYNTRPFSLYTKDGSEFSIRLGACNDLDGFEEEVRCHPIPERTIFFRVEEVNGCCATLRGLIPICHPRHVGTKELGNTLESQHQPNPHGKGVRWIATPFCCTVDLEQYIGIQCFQDTFVRIPPC